MRNSSLTLLLLSGSEILKVPLRSRLKALLHGQEKKKDVFLKISFTKRKAAMSP